MSTEVKIPAVGESITSGIVSVWHKKSGDQVKAGDALFTLETDKVSTEITAEKDGVLELPASAITAARVPAAAGFRNRDYHRAICLLQVFVRDNNVDQALRILKKKMQREGVFREMKRRKAYEKPSERKNREKAEAIRRARKAARKQAQRDGLIPAPKPRELTRGGVGRGRVGGMQSQGRA